MHRIKYTWEHSLHLKNLSWPLCATPVLSSHSPNLPFPSSLHPWSSLQFEVSTCNKPKPSVLRLPQKPQFPMLAPQMIFTIMFFLNSPKHKVLTLCSYDQRKNKPFLDSWQQENMLCFCSAEQSLEMPCLIFQGPLQCCWLRSQMKNSDVDRCESQGISLGDSGCLQFSRTNGKTTGGHRCTDPWGTHTQSSLWHWILSWNLPLLCVAISPNLPRAWEIMHFAGLML